MKVKKITLRYLPFRLSKNDTKKQAKMLLKSRNLYKKKKYYTRRPLKSFINKTSNFISKAKKEYGVESINASPELSKKSGCTLDALKQIIRKGEGAYYSSGSRPNQTPQSWGKARLASTLVSGKAAAIDNSILMEGCKKGSKGWKSARKALKIYGKGKHKVTKRKIRI